MNVQEMFSKISIYIPSLGRADNVHTLRQFSTEAKANTTIVCREDELEAYKTHNRDVDIVSVPEQRISLGAVRGRLVRDCKAKYCLLLDDDLTFRDRLKSGDWHTEKTKPENFNRLLLDLVGFMEDNEICHGSLCCQEGSNRWLKDWAFNQRYCRFLAYRTEDVQKMQLGVMNFQDDFDIALQMMRAGYRSAVCYLHSQHHPGSNVKGGCFEQRSLDKHKQECELLHSRHPDFVKLVRKKTKVSWGGQERTDVVIFWKRAYDSSKVLEPSSEVPEPKSEVPEPRAATFADQIVTEEIDDTPDASILHPF